MEITNELKQDLSTLESACGNFLEKYESVLTSALNKQEMSAEESLKIDLMLELITHLSSAQFAASYMQNWTRMSGNASSSAAARNSGSAV